MDRRGRARPPRNSADQRLARSWAAALHRHPADFDGIAFPSRFRTGDNLALFHARVGGALRVVARRRVLDSPVELGRACHGLNRGIIKAAREPE